MIGKDGSSVNFCGKSSRLATGATGTMGGNILEVAGATGAQQLSGKVGLGFSCRVGLSVFAGISKHGSSANSVGGSGIEGHLLQDELSGSLSGLGFRV